MRDVILKMQEKKNKRKKVVKIVLNIFLLLLVFAICAMILKYKGKIKESYTDSTSNFAFKSVCLNKKEGKCEVNAIYPKLSNENITKKIEEIVNEIIVKNSGENKTLDIWYGLFTINDNYISFQVITKADKNYAISNYMFDTKSSEIVDDTTFIKQEKITEFKEYIQKAILNNENIKNNVLDTNNYSLLFKNNNLEIDFKPKNSIDDLHNYPRIYISYISIKEYLNDKIVVKSNDMYTLKEQIIPEVETPTRPINKSKKLIALTFDDGPHASFTNEILATLKKYNSAATFFVLGSRAGANPNVLKNIINSGSEIGNHSWSHPQLTKLSVSAMKKEINDTQNAVYNATHTYSKFVRPPYGAVNASVKANIGKPMILWNVDTLDWKTKNTQMIVNEIMKHARDGSIILLHDIHATSKEAALIAIPKLKEQGFELVTMTEMFKAKGIKPVSGKVYTNL